MGNLVGTLEMPMALGLVGGATKTHPAARAALKILGVETAQELAEVTVAVESGSVGVQGRSAAASAARLSAGLGTHIAGDGRVAPAAAVDLGAAMAWREGKLLFKDQPLSLVAAAVSRYRHSPVRIRDAGTGALRLSSVFRADDTDALLAALPQFLPVGVRTLPDGSTEIFSR